MIELLYLVAIAAANVSVAILGPSWSVVIAFLFVGLDLTLRDVLHRRWEGRYLWPRMLSLIVVGGVVSWVATPGAGVIAIASTVAFVLASVADAIVYVALGGSSSRTRVYGSNLAGALVDSLAFPTLAFGAFLPLIVLGQFAAKVVGGAVWYEAIRAVSLREGPS